MKWLEPYNPEWPAKFEQISLVIREYLEGLPVDVQHVGSTAIPGMLAKPVLDIDILIEEKSLLTRVTHRLEKAGYEPRGDQGIAGRFAFRPISAFSPLTITKNKWMDHHLYVCYKDSLALKNHLLFRNALQQDPQLAAQYCALKRSLAKKLFITKQAYTTGKTHFIVSVLAGAGLSEQELSEIMQDNL